MLRQILLTTLFLLLFAAAGTGVVAFIEDSTRERIAENERLAMLDRLNEIVPPSTYDNALLSDTVEVRDAELLGTVRPVTVYRARRSGQPIAAVIAAVAPDGYAGEIRLLIGIRNDGTLSGVRVVRHRETPGLGDPIEARRSDWITRFAGHSLGNPGDEGWKVKRDGGTFDQFTGATITPRAVVKAVHHALLYFRAHRDELFAPVAAGARKP
jgi:electron transport complex protein RnfG